MISSSMSNSSKSHQSNQIALLSRDRSDLHFDTIHFHPWRATWKVQREIWNLLVRQWNLRRNHFLQVVFLRSTTISQCMNKQRKLQPQLFLQPSQQNFGGISHRRKSLLFNFKGTKSLLRRNLRYLMLKSLKKREIKELSDFNSPKNLKMRQSQKARKQQLLEFYKELTKTKSKWFLKHLPNLSLHQARNGMAQRKRAHLQSLHTHMGLSIEKCEKINDVKSMRNVVKLNLIQINVKINFQ